MMKGMKAMRHLVALVCLVVLLAALTPLAGVPFAILVPLWFFFAIVVSVPTQRIEEHDHQEPFHLLPVFSPRPPPVR